MYVLNAIVTINPSLPDNKRTLEFLELLEKKFLEHLSSFLFESKSDTSYYHPDEESEMQGVYYAVREIHLKRRCHKFRSIVCLSQIIRSVADLLDGVNGITYKCLILDPEICEMEEC